MCNVFDAYVGVSKEVRKDWNNHFIAFIPFLCGLTLELSHHLSSICVLESSSKLLFQQSMDDVKQVRSFMPLHVSSFLHIKSAHVPSRLYWKWTRTSKSSKEAKVLKSFKRLHPKLKKK